MCRKAPASLHTSNSLRNVYRSSETLTSVQRIRMFQQLYDLRARQLTFILLLLHPLPSFMHMSHESRNASLPLHIMAQLTVLMLGNRLCFARRYPTKKQTIEQFHNIQYNIQKNQMISQNLVLYIYFYNIILVL